MNMSKLLQIIDGDTNQSPITLRILLSPKRAGALLGKSGIVHRALESTYNVRLYFHQNTDHYGRLASIFGRLDNVAETLREALYRMYTARGEGLNFGEKLGMTFLVPHGLAMQLEPGSDCGALASISTQTGVRILLKRDVLPNTTELILEVSIQNLEPQNLDAFRKAIRMLGESFLRHRREALSPRNIYYVPRGMARQKSASHGTQNQDENSDSDGEKLAGRLLKVEGGIGTEDLHFQPVDTEQEEQWHNDFLTNSSLAAVTSFSTR